MSKSYKCFMIPSASVPPKPTVAVWFAAWSPDRPGIVWSSDPASITPGMTSTWIAVAEEDAIPPGATVIGNFTKEIPPPPLALVPRTPSVSDFQEAFTSWLTTRPQPSRSA